MYSTKKTLGTSGVMRPFNPPARHAAQLKPAVDRLKTGVSAQSAKQPVAPPAYNAPPQKNAVQRQVVVASAPTRNATQNGKQLGPPTRRPLLPNAPCQLKNRPRAPEVYRSQPAPKVLQTRNIHGRPLPATPEINNVWGRATIQRQTGPGQKLSPVTRNAANVSDRLRINQPHPGPSKGPLMKSVVAPRPDAHKHRVGPPTRSVMQLAAASSQSTTISLTIGRYPPFSGKSGEGHAEMKALDTFLQGCGETKEEAFDEAKRILNSRVTKKVSCTEKPVCGSCTIVLQALGFAAGAGTVFSEDKSGGVSWGASNLVAEFMDFMGLGEQYATAKRNGAK